MEAWNKGAGAWGGSLRALGAGAWAGLTGWGRVVGAGPSGDGTDVRSDVRTDVRTDGRKFPPVFYRTSSPSGPLPCLNFSILKKTPRASNGQQYPLPCCAHFRFPKCV